MKVKSLLDTKSQEVVSLDSGSSVEDAIRLMHNKKISAVMVMENGRTSGIFTERDVVRCYIAKDGKKFGDVPLRDAMTTDLIVAGQNDNVGDIMAIMVQNNIRHLPVVERDAVIGMLSIRDVIGFCSVPESVPAGR